MTHKNRSTIPAAFVSLTLASEIKLHSLGALNLPESQCEQFRARGKNMLFKFHSSHLATFNKR